MRSLVFCILLFVSFSTLAQSGGYGPTSTTSLNPVEKPKKDRENKRLLSIYKKDPKKTLIGNRCMEEVTRSMGFEYVLQPKGRQGNRTEAGRWIHNLGAKIGLLFRNGPFWKIKLNKKRKECMVKTGDYVG